MDIAVKDALTIIIHRLCSQRRVDVEDVGCKRCVDGVVAIPEQRIGIVRRRRDKAVEGGSGFFVAGGEGNAKYYEYYRIYWKVELVFHVEIVLIKIVSCKLQY
jgi:hypothetical protein